MPTKARGVATFILIFASFMDLIDATIVNVALPSIRTIWPPPRPSWSGS
jgi:hypothetical protein